VVAWRSRDGVESFISQETRISADREDSDSARAAHCSSVEAGMIRRFLLWLSLIGHSCERSLLIFESDGSAWWQCPECLRVTRGARYLDRKDKP